MSEAVVDDIVAMLPPLLDSLQALIFEHSMTSALTAAG